MSMQNRKPHYFSGPYMSCIFSEHRRTIECISKNCFECICNRFDARDAAERVLLPEIDADDYHDLRTSFLDRMTELGITEEMIEFLADRERSMLPEVAVQV